MSSLQQLFWSDAFAPTSLGTGVSKTTLNGGAAYSVSAKASYLIEATPEVTETGAHTAAESMMIRWIAESDSIPSITPKEWVTTGALGGLGTFASVMYPVLKAYPFNTRTGKATVNITFSGQAQIANTAAVEGLLDLTFTDGGPLDTEQFYIAPANETNTGLTAGEVAGNQITINNGSAINMLMGNLTTGVVTASEDVHGRYQLASSNFITVPSPQRWVAQPIGAALGSAVAVAIPADRVKKCWIPIATSFTGDTAFQLDEALTATGNFIVGVGYKK